MANSTKKQRAEHDCPKAGIKVMAKRIHGPKAAALLYVKRDAKCGEGKIPGTFTTDPAEIDAVVRRAWQHIYKGNVADVSQTVQDFMTKYDRYIFKAPQGEASVITEDMVKAAFAKGGKSAAAWIAGNRRNLPSFQILHATGQRRFIILLRPELSGRKAPSTPRLLSWRRREPNQAR